MIQGIIVSIIDFIREINYKIAIGYTSALMFFANCLANIFIYDCFIVALQFISFFCNEWRLKKKWHLLKGRELFVVEWIIKVISMNAGIWWNVLNSFKGQLKLCYGIIIKKMNMQWIISEHKVSVVIQMMTDFLVWISSLGCLFSWCNYEQ